MRSKILKFLAVISFGLVTFPFVLTNDVLAFENISALRILCYYGGFGVIFGFGFAFGNWAGRRKKRLIAEKTVGILSFSAGFLLLFITDEVNIICAVGISAVLWFFLGGRASRKHYADIFPAFMFGVYIVVTLLCYLFYGAMCERELKEPVQNAVIIAFMAELCLAALLINQSGIYDKANRRRETRTMLPKGLSGYNAALVLGVTLIGSLFYLFSDKIVELLNIIVKTVIKLFLFIMKGHSEFMATEAVDYDNPSFSGYMPVQTSDIWNVIFFALFITAVILFRKKLLAVLKNILKRIYGFFARETAVSEPEPEFVDVFEEIGTTRRNRPLNYQKAMKLYKSEADPVKKYRYGYSVLLRQLRYCKADIRHADTVGVQCEKGREICGAALESVAADYDKVRYNNGVVTEAQLMELDKLIEAMNGLMRIRI